MTAQELRETFINFFERQGHKALPSSSLVPHNDDTLLFANAGMNQFKDTFTGAAKAPHPRAVTIQKCVRAGGKHNDLENVGHTARHHTYFEMLGNFSFGDYFKADAIKFAWDFLTVELGLPPSKLVVTVHQDDEEALKLWPEQTGIEPARLYRRGDADNFWEMGEYGPCGPCSEIFFDYGKKYTTAGFVPGEANPFDDGGRFVEIWNLVFMQYEKTPEGRRPLPNPSIDTGMGLERLLAVLGGVYFNYETDLFLPLTGKLEKMSSRSYKNPKDAISMRVVADHARCCCMLIGDGVIPGSEGRGYVLRRIIRRAVRHLRELGIAPGGLHQMVDPVFELLGQAWPENAAGKSLVKKFLRIEEEKFLETLEQGLKFLKQALRKDVQNKTLSGQAAFKLYDTYGFPLDLTETILQERKLALDKAGFEQAMRKRVEDSRKSWKGTQAGDNKQFHAVLKEHQETVFTGYDRLEDSAKLLKILPVNGTKALVFDQTPFYAEGGGQVGDVGVVCQQGRTLAHIRDTGAPVEGLHVHYSEDADVLVEGQKYQLQVCPKRREKIAKNHSATHLLHAALIKVLGDHVKQAGSLVNDEKLRFDFTHMQAMTKEEIRVVEELVNAEVASGHKVRASLMSMKEARGRGAMALFGEKYGEQVRVLAMGDFSTELCGGTHVENTADIGLFTIVSETSLSAGVRRIEALTSKTAVQRLRSRSSLLHQVEQMTAAKGEGVLQKIQALQEENKAQAKTIHEMNDKSLAAQSGDLLAGVETLGDGVVFKFAQVPQGADMKKISDGFAAKYELFLLVLYNIKGERAGVLVRAGKKLKGIDCRQFLQDILSVLGGKGGGRIDLAQGSGEACKIDLLEKKVRKSLPF